MWVIEPGIKPLTVPSQTLNCSVHNRPRRRWVGDIRRCMRAYKFVIGISYRWSRSFRGHVFYSEARSPYSIWRTHTCAEDIDGRRLALEVFQFLPKFFPFLNRWILWLDQLPRKRVLAVMMQHVRQLIPSRFRLASKSLPLVLTVHHLRFQDHIQVRCVFWNYN